MKSLYINTCKNIISRKNQSGMTLTESLLVLGIGALVAVLAYGGYKVATSDVKSLSQTKGTVQLAGKIKQIYGQAANYGTASADMYTTIKNAKIVPTDFKDNVGTSYVNAWGGAVLVFVGANAAQFTITHQLVPAEGCVEFLSGLNSAASVALTMGVGAVSVKTATGDFNTTAAVTQCSLSSTATAGSQTVILTSQ